MIVRESIEFQRGGETPLKSLSLGHIELVKKQFDDENISISDMINNLERISKFTLKIGNKIFAEKELSNALNTIFEEGFYPEKQTANIELRKFFKELIFDIKRNKSKLSEMDFYEYASGFFKKFNIKPLEFEEIINSIKNYTEENIF